MATIPGIPLNPLRVDVPAIPQIPTHRDELRTTDSDQQDPGSEMWRRWRIYLDKLREDDKQTVDAFKGDSTGIIVFVSPNL